ncbi:MAG: signal peptidase I [Candidatus Azobacteroides sp.]|nr:signal peptidase I [Candidatus Azobacteroides sp.]
MTIKSILKNLRFAIKIIGIAIILAICLRVFVFDSFKIPSPSMQPTILAGDYILVNKLVLGGRIYKNFDFMKGGIVETKRLWGWRKVKRNDVLVFNFPYSDRGKLDFDLNVFYVKRCVAIPGDTFYIDNGIYKVKNCPDTLGYYKSQRRFADTKQEQINPDVWKCFPYDKAYQWNVRQFGPLYVPGKGDTLRIDTNNIKLYRKLIRYETGKRINIQGDTVYLGNDVLQQYVFKKNYYFMAGDLVRDSRDSRYWGLLPEDHIVGKAAIIWKSEDMKTRKYRWKRFFKTIN